MNIRQSLAPVAALLIGVSILLTGQGLQGTLLPVRASLEGFSTISIGIFGGAYFLGFTLGCLKGPQLMQTAGHVRVFAAMTALASATPLLHGLILYPWVWSIFRLMSGFCLAVLYVVIESWLNERSDNANRGTIFSVYVMITLSMMALGQMMTLLHDPQEMTLFALASVLVSVAALPVVLSTTPSPSAPTSTKLDLRRLYAISPAGCLGCLATGLANGSFWSLAPVFTNGISDNTSLAAWFMSSAVIGGALSQWPLGFLSDKIGRRKILSFAALIGILCSVAFMLSTGSLSFVRINILGALWGAAAFPLYAVAVAHANDHAEANEYVMVSSGLLLIYGLGAIIGPFVASAIMTLTQSSGLFLFTGVIHLLLLLYALLRMGLREGVSGDQQTDFGDALTAAVTASSSYEEEIQQQVEELEEIK